MLQYRDNINYYQPQTYNIDQELSQLNELCRDGITDYELYQRIRSYIYKEIKINELAITKILPDLLQIKNHSQKAFEVVSFFLVYNSSSYQQIAEMLGCSRQLVYYTIKMQAKKYQWLAVLMQIKGDEDSKNEINRTIFPKRKGKTFNLFQLFEVGDEE